MVTRKLKAVQDLGKECVRVSAAEPLLGGRSADYADPRQHDRRPFSGVRCVVEPQRALEHCRGFATLSVLVDKAQGLRSADLNGLSDPYVTVSLNGRVFGRTRTVRFSLAPSWERRFEVEVQQPRSVLTIQVIDFDTGTTALRSFDDLLGFVDLRTGALPLNQTVAGWFELTDPDQFRDTVQGRLNAASLPGQGAGYIWLELRLSTEQASDELFALCLPPPDLGHGYPALDLEDLMESIHLLSEQADRAAQPILRLKSALYGRISLVWVGLLLLVWMPDLVLPCMLVMLGMAFEYIAAEKSLRKEHCGDSSSDDEVACGNVVQESAIDALDRVASVAAAALGRKPTPQEQDALSKQGTRRDEDAESSCIAASVGRAEHRRCTSPQSEEEDEEEKDHDHQFFSTLRMAQRLMPSSHRMHVRSAQAHVSAVLSGLTSIRELGERKGHLAGKCCYAAGVFLLILARFAPGSQILLIQVSLTLLVSAVLAHHSALGNFCLMLFYYYVRHRRLRVRGGEREKLEITSAQARELALSPPAQQLEGRSHQLLQLKGFRIKRCSTCGRMTAKAMQKRKPMRCILCKQVICRRCLDRVVNDCPGKPLVRRVSTKVKAAW